MQSLRYLQLYLRLLWMNKDGLTVENTARSAAVTEAKESRFGLVRLSPGSCLAFSFSFHMNNPWSIFIMGFAVTKAVTSSIYWKLSPSMEIRFNSLLLFGVSNSLFLQGNKNTQLNATVVTSYLLTLRSSRVGTRAIKKLNVVQPFLRRKLSIDFLCYLSPISFFSQSGA